MKKLLLVVICLLFTCGGVKIGPFAPADAPLCRSDVDCLPSETCRFPAVDTRPVCMPAPEGENESRP